MTSLSRMCLATTWFAAAGFLVAAALWNAAAASPSARKPSNDPGSPEYRVPDDGHADGAERDKLLPGIKEKLDGFKPNNGKKEAGDYFVVGTIALQDHHADVEYVIKQGVQQTADFIVDFVLGKAKDEIRIWQVFGRTKNLKAAEVLRAKSKAKSIEDQLAAFKRNTPGKKKPDDYFVVGTADLNTATEHANVRFEILNGVKAAADFLIDFVYSCPKNHQGEWHVFYRAGTEAQAIEYRQKMRDWYDSQEAQRAQIAAIYKAKSTARC